MNKVIKLSDYQRGFRWCALGFSFPTVYRQTGFSWKYEKRDGNIYHIDEPDRNYPCRHYALDDKPTGTFAEETFTPITRLDSFLDSGWVIVRHHFNHERIRGYLDGMEDFEAEQSPPHRMIYQNSAGLFSIASRPALPGCRDLLLVYKAWVPVGDGKPPAPFDFDQQTRAIDSTGELLGDEATWPPEEDLPDP